MKRPAKTKKSGATSAATATERILELLREGIKSGRYAPGQRLRETDLVEELAYSKGPIREAMQALSRDGLVQIEPHRGFVVRRLSRADIEDIYELLEPLAGVAASGAAKAVASGVSARPLRSALNKISTAAKSGNIAGFMEAVDAWRKVLDQLGGNKQLPKIISQLRVPMFRLQVRSFIRVSEMPLAVGAYQSITEAIAAGDAKAAERAIRKHVRTTAKSIQELPDELFE